MRKLLFLLFIYGCTKPEPQMASSQTKTPFTLTINVYNHQPQDTIIYYGGASTCLTKFSLPSTESNQTFFSWSGSITENPNDFPIGEITMRAYEINGSMQDSIVVKLYLNGILAKTVNTNSVNYFSWQEP